MSTLTTNLKLVKPELTDNITPTIFADNFDKLDAASVSTYTHTRSGTVHNFVGSGANGKAKITAAFTTGDTFAVNGVPVKAYCGSDSPDGDTIVNGRWVTFVYDGNQLNFNGGGGLSLTKLALADAEVANVRVGKKFYAKDKTIKTGTLTDAMIASEAGLNEGNLCAGNTVLGITGSGHAVAMFATIGENRWSGGSPNRLKLAWTMGGTSGFGGWGCWLPAGTYRACGAVANLNNCYIADAGSLGTRIYGSEREYGGSQWGANGTFALDGSQWISVTSGNRDYTEMAVVTVYRV